MTLLSKLGEPYLQQRVLQLLYLIVKHRLLSDGKRGVIIVIVVIHIVLFDFVIIFVH